MYLNVTQDMIDRAVAARDNDKTYDINYDCVIAEALREAIPGYAPDVQACEARMYEPDCEGHPRRVIRNGKYQRVRPTYIIDFSNALSKYIEQFDGKEDIQPRRFRISVHEQ